MNADCQQLPGCALPGLLCGAAYFVPTLQDPSESFAHCLVMSLGDGDLWMCVGHVGKTELDY